MPRLLFIVNGDEVPVMALGGDTLRKVLSEVLLMTYNNRPIEEWEVRSPLGRMIGLEIVCQDIPREWKPLYVTIAVGHMG